MGMTVWERRWGEGKEREKQSRCKGKREMVLNNEIVLLVTDTKCGFTSKAVSNT